MLKKPSNSAWTAAALLFGSGFCALIYQVAWLREFRLVFGASTAATAAVVAIFVGGLGFGGLMLGPLADRHKNPLRLYAVLEAIVAVCAALSPFLLTLARAMYLASGGVARLGFIPATAGRLVASAIVLAVPTLAMGGTLPAAARAVTLSTDARRQRVALLYGINTLGAVVGCLLSNFWMLERFGTRRTLWLAAVVNLQVAIVARMIADRGSQISDSAGSDASEIANQESPINPQSAIRNPQFLLLASATVGFSFFLLELIWYRLLAPLLGGSVFTFGLVLALALAGIALGGLAYAVVSSERPATLYGFAGSCLLEAAMVAATYALGDRVALLALFVMPLRSAGFAAQTLGWTAVASMVVLPPAVVAGYQFPLLIALFGRARERLGRQVGLAYAANTLGAIIGSLAGGFGLLPWLSAPTAWKLVGILLVALGAAAAVAAEREVRPTRAGARTVCAFLGAATIALLFAAGPTAVWRHSGIGSGRTAAEGIGSRNTLRGWEQTYRRALQWDGDGVESSVALVADQNGYSFIVNGKSDGSARGDAGTFVMSGLVAALRVPDARKALVVGLGTGSTAGWLAAIPAMERVDVVELEPLVLDVARACRAVNHGALENPKLHITIGDARETLMTSRDRYDIIVSEPSNPFRAGIASLFTAEYYRAARERITSAGVFAQWIQAYEIDARTLRTVYATLTSVFPYVETWQTARGDLVLVAGASKPMYHAGALSAQIASEPFRSALANAWRVTDAAGLFGHYIGSDALAAAVARMPDFDLNTDDRNVVEFGLARSVGRTGSALVVEIRRFATASGFQRPPIDDFRALSWEAADTTWLEFNGWGDGAGESVLQAHFDEQVRRDTLRRYFELGDVAGARESWRRQSGGPTDVNELMMAADVEAEAESESAVEAIDRLRLWQPAEADTILAVLRYRQNRPDEAAAALRSALARFDADPWPILVMKQKALATAMALGSRYPTLARPLYDSVMPPFALKALDDQRLYTAAQLSRLADFRGLCRGPIGAFEPNIPWREDFLRMRADCYVATDDARLPAAAKDLDDYMRGEAQPFVGGTVR